MWNLIPSVFLIIYIYVNVLGIPVRWYGLQKWLIQFLIPQSNLGEWDTQGNDFFFFLKNADTSGYDQDIMCELEFNYIYWNALDHYEKFKHLSKGERKVWYAWTTIKFGVARPQQEIYKQNKKR